MEYKSIKKRVEEADKILMSEFDIKNKLAVPRITKVVVNMGTGDALKDKKIMEKLADDLATFAGQKPVIKKAKLSVAGFGIREGNPVGLSVTLRKKKMYDFLERLIATALPRIRDFRGVPLKGFDHHGNYSIGFSEYTLFPEIDITKITRKQGFEVTIVTDTKDVEKSKRLLELIGVPFEKEE